MTTMITLGTITRSKGAAGAIQYTVDVTYEGEPTSRVTFVGSTYGGPVVMITPSNPKGTFVTEPSRFGEFGAEWVRRFFCNITD